MKIAFFGSSLVSAYWNGAATYYRGILKALAARGHEITFFEPDAFDRQKNRDIADPEWANVVVYLANEAGVDQAIGMAMGADLIVKASGVGVFDSLLEAAVLLLKCPSNLVAFWDVDAPATLNRVIEHRDDPFAALIPCYDMVFTYGGGQPVIDAYRKLGARACVPIYNGLDPDTHHPVPPVEQFKSDLAFLGNRLPDREARVEEFFLKPASQLSEQKFLLGGAGWGDKPKPSNVRYVDHVFTADHNAFNCSSRMVLNISRDSMAQYGFSPATRVFEAAGAGACMITDDWAGIEMFFEPGREILVARDGDEVADFVRHAAERDTAAIGEAALKRALAEHTYAKRAELVESILEGTNLRAAGALL